LGAEQHAVTDFDDTPTLGLLDNLRVKEPG
jgi:hypothetical protein